MVDMADGADVDVRLVALELLLRHWWSSPWVEISVRRPNGRRTAEM
jgi:hypothetical protein